MAAGILLNCLLPIKARRNPLMILLVPSVVIKGGRLNLAMKMELNRPSRRPMIMPHSSRTAMGAEFQYRPKRRETVCMANTAMAIKDRSMPPEIITTRLPMARMPVSVILFKTSKRFLTVKKEGLTRPKTIHIRAMTANRKNSLDFTILRRFIPLPSHRRLRSRRAPGPLPWCRRC